MKVDQIRKEHRQAAPSFRSEHVFAAEGIPRVQLFPAVILLVYLAVLLTRFAYSRDTYLSFFTDDFFYYLVIAKNLIRTGASTFNGLQSTNGYHPLWLLTIVALVRVFGSGVAFFVALLLLIWVLVGGSYWLLRQIQAAFGMGGEISLACALFSLTFMAVISRTGMEVSLALFFLLLFWRRVVLCALEEQSRVDAFLSGLLAAVAILSRLDAALVVIAYGALTLFRPSGDRMQAVSRLLWFAVGLSPILLYMGINDFSFGTLLPVSGMVKNLKSDYLPSLSTLESLLRANSINILFTYPSVLVLLAFMSRCKLHLFSANEDRPPARHRVQACIMLHPLLFYGVLSCSSDWRMWTWYLYPLVPMAALLGPSVMSSFDERRMDGASKWSAIAVSCLCVAILVSLARLNPLSMPIYEQALDLARFATSHPGVYGMGDAAGTPAYLMQVPIIQLEGLVGDKAYLQRIARSEPLLEALRQLHVDYYVTTAPRWNGRCYDVREPAEDGARSPAMRAELCANPVADFRPPGATDTMVFDLHAFRRADANGLLPVSR